MYRRTFVGLLAGLPLRAFQTRAGIPAFRVVTGYRPAQVPGMPGPYPGRVVAVSSPACVDVATGAANAELVREMMARGMRALTSASSTADAWRRFFSPSDVVGKAGLEKTWGSDLRGTPATIPTRPRTSACSPRNIPRIFIHRTTRSFMRCASIATRRVPSPFLRQTS